MKEIDVEGLFGALGSAKPGDKIKLSDHIKEEKTMNTKSNEVESKSTLEVLEGYFNNVDDQEYAESINALILEEDAVIATRSNGDIKIDNDVFDAFEKGTVIDIYVIKKGFLTSSYIMQSQDADGIWMEYIGEARN